MHGAPSLHAEESVDRRAMRFHGGGTWLIDLKSGPAVKSGDGPASCTVRMTSTDFVDLFEGRANGQALFFTGKLKSEGDMGLALKLESLTSIRK